MANSQMTSADGRISGGPGCLIPMRDGVYRLRDDGCQRIGLVDMMMYVPLVGFSMVEIGSYAGASADIFAACPKLRSLWCIDPWLPGYDPEDPASYTDFVSVEAEFDKVMQRHPGKIHKFKGVFTDFVLANPEFVPDLVYIDANHAYESCRADISAVLSQWHGKGMRFIAGHDYSNPNHTGVRRAIDEVLGVPDRVFADTSWIFDVGRAVGARSGLGNSSKDR